MPKNAVNPTSIVDGFAELSAGMNSGVAPILLKRNQAAYAFNCTFRGDFIKPRPARRKIKLTLNDPTINLADVIYQGGTYYQPDFGQESIVSLIGGRLYQFLPDTDQGATVYDRTIQVVASSISGNTTTVTSKTILGIITLMNINDGSGQQYPNGTVVLNDPANLCYNTQAITTPAPMTNGTQFLDLLVNQNVTASNGTDINWFFTSPAYPTLYWKIIGRAPGQVNVQFVSTVGEVTNSFTIPVGTMMQQVHPAPPPAVTVGTILGAMPVIPVGSSAPVTFAAPYAGSLNQIVTIGSGQYLITAATTQTNTTLSGSGSTVSSTGAVIGFDPNPSNLQQAWLWQSENYIIGNDGYSVPIIFDGVSARRSNTASYSGLTATAFVVPNIGSTVQIQLATNFTDLVGRFIQITATGLFPFSMQVESISGNTITAVNITGLSAYQQGATIPAGSAVLSVPNPTYSGITSTNITPMPAPDSPVTLTFIPQFNGKIDDTILLTDGTGSITEYEFTVTGIQNGGLTVIANNVNAPTGLIVNAGFPAISATNIPSELPVGRMGAYVDGRNWISSPSGQSYFASDQNGDSTGTEEFGFRDAVLKWSLNTALFPVPGGAGRINAITPLSAVNVSLGQGPLQICCDNDVFSAEAPSNSTQWTTTTNPFVVETAIGFGGSGQGTAIVCNGDLFLKSTSGDIFSIQLAEQNFYQWGTFPISREMARVLDGEDLDLIQFLRGDLSDNRLLMPTQPIDSPCGVFGQGVIALDFDVTSSLRGKEPSVYDGFWKDLNVLQVITGNFSNVDRTFVFTANTVTNEIELWELTDALFDDAGSGATVPIVWGFETPVMFNNLKSKGEFEYCQLQDAEIYISDLVGPVIGGIADPDATGKIKAWYRPDFDPCWYPWHECTFTQKNLPRIGLGTPNSECCAFTGNRRPNFGRFFQLRFELTGSFIIKGGLAMVTREPQPDFEPPICNITPP